MPAPLDGLRILELADGPAGGFCGRQFADWGAEVVMLEAAGGGPLRQAGPRWRLGGREGSAAFEMLACGKQSAGLGHAQALLSAADVLVCDLPEAVVRTRVGAGFAEMRALNPGLVVVVLDSAGLPGGATAELEAACGYMSLNGPADGPPLPAPAHIMAHAIGANAFAGALAALIARERTGRGDTVRVSGLETIASFIMWLREQHQSGPTVRNGGTPEGARLVRCADGMVSVAPAVAVHLPAYREVLGVPEGVCLEALVEAGGAQAADEVAAALAPFAARLDVEEVFLGLQVRGVACGKVQTPRQVLDDRQLEDLAFFRTLEHPWAGAVPLAGRPARMTGVTRLRPRPAPEPASADEPPPAWAPRTPPGTRHVAPAPPLGGLRVLDLTQAWIGPMAGVLLADLGAQVIKVEGLNRPDIWRLLGQVEEEPGETPTSPLNRSRYFNGANRSKRGLALDLGHPAGAEAFLRLVAEADVVLENFTPGVMRRFGLDFARLSAVRPDLVMTSFSGFGAEGPHAGFKANGASIEALAGWAALHRDAEGRPVQMGGYPADPMCGLQMAASTLVALYRRARGGGGAHVEGSMLEAASGYLGDVLLAEALARAGAESADDPALQVRLGEIAGRWAVEGGAGPVAVATTWEALADPRLRDWLIPLASPGRPDGRHPGYLWRFADAPLAPASPPPRLGEHTAEVLSLCLSTAEVAALVASGVAGTVD